MHKITIDHFQRVQFLSAIALSPAGQPAWVGTKIQDDAYVSQLYILDQDQPKCLTQGHESLFIWDDDQTLLFASSRGEKPQPHRWRGSGFGIYAAASCTRDSDREAGGICADGSD